MIDELDAVSCSSSTSAALIRLLRVDLIWQKKEVHPVIYQISHELSSCPLPAA
jgi:hypothetical protein